VAHHGSLSKKVREDAEEAIKANEKVVAFASSTLEIGIDIGDIDLVVIDGPAPNVSALLQRIGRGNRRTNLTKVLLCAESKADSVLQRAMVNAAENGWLFADDVGPNYSVAMQQIASYIFQSPKRTRNAKYITDLMKACIGPDMPVEQIIETMKQNEELVEDEAGIRLGDRWLDLTSSGEIHSNIESDYGYKVIDEMSGDVIATGIRNVSGHGLKTGGQLLQIRRISDFDIEVKKVKDERHAQGEWKYVSRKGFFGPSQAYALRKYLEINDEEWPVIHSGDRLYVFHLGGEVRQTVIEALAKLNAADLEPIISNGFYFSFPAVTVDKPAWLTEYRKAGLELLINSEIDWFENKLRRPAANRDLPKYFRVSEVKEWLNLDVELYNITHSVFITDKYTDTLLHFIT